MTMHSCNTCAYVFSTPQQLEVSFSGESELIDTCPRCNSFDIEELKPENDEHTTSNTTSSVFPLDS